MGTVSAAAAASGGTNPTFLILIVVVFVGFYFLMIRPQRRRQQRVQQQQNSITPGARVRTTAGMYATVVAVDGDDVILEVAPDIEVRYMKRAIMDVVGEGDPADYAEDAPEDSHDGEGAEHHGEWDADTTDAWDGTKDSSDDVAETGSAKKD
jgi:preprotein translocase subunit YajC